jgi:hypothetical protein
LVAKPQPEFEEELSVFDTCMAHPEKSIFSLCERKIEIDSIYDCKDAKNKSRFT